MRAKKAKALRRIARAISKQSGKPQNTEATYNKIKATYKATKKEL